MALGRENSENAFFYRGMIKKEETVDEKLKSVKKNKGTNMKENWRDNNGRQRNINAPNDEIKEEQNK